MEVFEITGTHTGVSRAGVNYLQPSDSYQNMFDGYIYRQVLYSRRGFRQFTPRLADESRVMGIFEYTPPTGDSLIIAMDKKQAYKYNPGTNAFVAIPFGGSIAAYTDFAIVENDSYISAASYPDKSNNGRMVFCFYSGTAPAGQSLIFFYDAVNDDIRCYTNTATDNPDYQQPLSPATGSASTLEKAHYVFAMNGRLNFGRPTIGGIEFNQKIIFSGINSSTGNGDKFAVAASGNIGPITQERISGISVNGQVAILNFDRSAYTLEITRDNFNPYFIRKVPGPLGTNANYSAVLWDDNVKSLGKTGILSNDGRRSLRCDNKIPQFTKNQITPNLFSLSYGGFDRENEQFLWTYADASGTSTTQDKVLVNNYEEDTWTTYNMRMTVFGQSDAGLNLTWDDIDETGNNPPEWETWDTTEDIWDEIGIRQGTQKTLAGDNEGFIYQLNQDFDDYFSYIGGITLGATTVITLDTPQPFEAGDKILVQGIESPGPTEINSDIPWEVVSSTVGTVTINFASTGLVAWTAGGEVSKPIAFYAETVPFNPYRSEGRRVYVSMIEFLIQGNQPYLMVDILANQQDYPIKNNVLVEPSQDVVPEWVSISVNQEAEFITLIMKHESGGSQVEVTSIRIHAKPGGMTVG